MKKKNQIDPKIENYLPMEDIPLLGSSVITTTNWIYQEGNWRELVQNGIFQDLGEIPLEEIRLPWAYNVHIHIHYNRLFWDIWERGVLTPLFVRPWSWPPKGRKRPIGCKEDGTRLDIIPVEYHSSRPKYELIIGNMRYVAAWVCGYKSLPALLLREDQWNMDIEDLWTEYHPVFEGNWYECFRKQRANIIVKAKTKGR